MNITTLTGRASKDWELKYTPAGKAVASGTIAVQRKFKNVQGQYEADFINLVAWGKTAELLCEYVRKGDHFGVSGSLQTRNYENSEGRKIYVTEVNVNEFDFPVKGKGQGGDEKHPNKALNENTDPFANDDKPIDIQDSDLPF